MYSSTSLELIFSNCFSILHVLKSHTMNEIKCKKTIHLIIMEKTVSNQK